MCDGKIVIQKVVRTYPGRYLNAMEQLAEALKNGFVVVMCHEIDYDKNEKCLEYIIEKKVEG